MPSEDTQVQFLISQGVMPSVAKRVVRESLSLTSPLGKPRARSYATITSEDIAAAAQWWLFNPSVPLSMKRILDASEV